MLQPFVTPGTAEKPATALLSGKQQWGVREPARSSVSSSVWQSLVAEVSVHSCGMQQGLLAQEDLAHGCAFSSSCSYF